MENLEFETLNFDFNNMSLKNSTDGYPRLTVHLAAGGSRPTYSIQSGEDTIGFHNMRLWRNKFQFSRPIEDIQGSPDTGFTGFKWIRAILKNPLMEIVCQTDPNYAQRDAKAEASLRLAAFSIGLVWAMDMTHDVLGVIGNVQEVRRILDLLSCPALPYDGYHRWEWVVRSSLRAARKRRNFEIYGVLMEYGADPRLDVDKLGQNVLHHMVKVGQHLGGFFDMLSSEEQGRDLLNGKTKEMGWTPLHQAAIDVDAKTSSRTMECLLSNGADIEAKDESGETALHLAVKAKRTPAVTCLLRWGANPNPKDKNGITPLMAMTSHNLRMTYCTYDDYIEMVEILVENGADVSMTTDKEKGGYTALHIAAKTFNKHMISALVARGANLRAHDSMGRTPLHLAIYNAQNREVTPQKDVAFSGVYDHLMRMEASMGRSLESAVDEKEAVLGNTPLLGAAQTDKWKMVKFLLEKGHANPDAKNLKGDTLRSIAEKRLFKLKDRPDLRKVSEVIGQIQDVLKHLNDRLPQVPVMSAGKYVARSTREA